MVGIANTYYFGRLQEKKPNIPVGIFWADQAASGVHVNVSGAGVTKYSKHPEAAQKLLEWLSSSKAQNLFADNNMEYPVNPQVKPDKRVAGWGLFRSHMINVSKAGDLQIDAIKLMDRAGYK
jgi:iron(III) transport system substrate-binding protein